MLPAHILLSIVGIVSVSAKIAWLHRPLFDVFIPFVSMSDVAAISSVFDRTLILPPVRLRLYARLSSAQRFTSGY